MSTQVVVRLDAAELAALDAEVRAGRAQSRSDALRRTIARLRREQRYQAEEAVLLDHVRTGESVYPDLQGIAGSTAHPALD